uniref:Uncharacterized protein n=1 Tax=Nelumbo nucifera TaxID=4432 RepID=A0A822ZSI9_NELNU|nr:TPA_asm: hypothetical protein HUJ06_016468 [Nelumbo nucifera]
MRVPFRHTRVHGGQWARRVGTSEWGRGCGRHDQRDRARTGRAVDESIGECLVCWGGSDSSHGDRGPVRGIIRDRRGRRFLVQWIWSPILKACAGPNALD